MTEQISTIGRGEDPGLVLIEGGKQAVETDAETASSETREFIACCLKVKETQLEWLRNGDIGSVVMLFDTLVGRLPKTDPLNTGELFRLSLLLEGRTDEEISAATKERFGKDMLPADVRCEQADILELVQDSLSVRGARTFVTGAMSMLKAEAELARGEDPLGATTTEAANLQADDDEADQTGVVVPLRPHVEDERPVEAAVAQSGDDAEEAQVEEGEPVVQPKQGRVYDKSPEMLPPSTFEEVARHFEAATGIDISLLLGDKHRHQRLAREHVALAETLRERLRYSFEQPDNLGALGEAGCTHEELRRLGHLLGFRVRTDNRRQVTLYASRQYSIGEIRANMAQGKKNNEEIAAAEAAIRSGFMRIADYFGE